MRVLAVLDTHGDRQILHHMTLSQPKAEVVIHSGDGYGDMEDEHFVHPERMFLQVCGNCGWGSVLPPLGEIRLEDRKIFYIHGDLYNVEYILDKIRLAAHLRKATILPFGHTHVPYTEYDNRLYVMNPGSLRGVDASYGIVDLVPQGAITSVICADWDGKEFETQRPKGFSYGWVKCQVYCLVSY